jgi:hypothetical protein
MNYTLLVICALIAITSVRASQAGQVQHIVLFRFKDTVTPDQKKQVMSEYMALKQKCVSPVTKKPYMVSFDAGFPNSPEGFDQKMEQGYILTFNSTSDRDYFVGQDHRYPFDPNHDKFKAFVGPFLRQPIETGLVVFDFTVLPLPSN